VLNTAAKISLTSSALAPVGFTYAYVAWQNGNADAAVTLICGSLFLVGLCLAILGVAQTNLEKFDFKISSVEAADRESMGLLLLYLLPLFTDKFDALNWNIWLPTIVVFGLVVGTGYSYHFNPLLGILRWHFYRVSTPEGVTYVIITKKHLRDTKGTLVVGHLTEYIVLDLEK
jgi:hypothetical protein